MLNKIRSIFYQDGLCAIFKRSLSKILRILKIRFEELISCQKSSYSLDSGINNIQLISRINPKNLQKLNLKECIPKVVSEHYLDHRFDLLGSGWVKVRYGMQCRGVKGYCFKKTKDIFPDIQGKWLKGRVNKANLTIAQKIWKRIDEDYDPIDWQLDFKSGYRWSEKIWAPHILNKQILGADIKVPWELSRMQHLPQLALRATTLGKADKAALQIVREIRNQWLDFTATNPPGFGANWACPMDIAIRSANWCITWDILQASGFLIEEEDKAILGNSLYDHGCFIMNNLEWSNDRANHYLANITGLIFIASYLKFSEKTFSWLRFSIQELIAEVDRQFYDEGTNFEGSTAYHRLSAEMVYFSTALIMGLPSEIQDKLKINKKNEVNNLKKIFSPQQPHLRFYSLPNSNSSIKRSSPFPKWYFKRMERMAEFIMDITKPNGHIPQIGDNDNGRFLKLYPKYTKMSVLQAKRKYINLQNYDSLSNDKDYYLEDHLDCMHLVNLGHALFKRSDFEKWLTNRSNRQIKNHDYLIIKSLSNSTIINTQCLLPNGKKKTPRKKIGLEKDFNNILLKIEENYKDSVLLFKSAKKTNRLNSEVTLYSYPDFGLYLFVSANVYLAVRCWSGKKPYVMSHMHLDQFSVELVIDGKEIISDPGTFVYTSIPMERWKYRSHEAHFSPLAYDEVENWKKLDPFSSLPLKTAQPIYFGEHGFFSSINKGLKHGDYCLISIQDNQIKLYGFKGDKNKVKRVYKGYKTSDGYGSISNNFSF